MSPPPNVSSKTPAPKGERAGTPRSFATRDLPIIRNALIFCVVSLLISIGIVIGSGWFVKSEQQKKMLVQSGRDQARAQANQADTERREIQDFQPKYMQLRQRGLIGEERRLDWVDYLQTIQRKRHLGSIAYDIAAQQTFEVEPPVLSGELKLRGSKITVKLDLLHEMDLFNFLTDLKTYVLYVPQSCNMTRVNTTTEDPLATHINAECTLYWLTMSADPAPVEGAPVDAAAAEAQQ